MNRKFLMNWKPMFAIAFLSMLTFSCTDLALEETDSIISGGEEGTVFEGLTDVDASLTNLYNDVYGQLGDQANFFALNEVSTDETLVPTRGTDWGDNGIWRTLHAHTWSPTHQYILDTWNNLNQNVLRASQIIDPLSEPTAAQEAQARFIRAFSMFFVVDMWGVAPFRNPTDGSDVDPSVLSSQEAYDFIVNDLTTAIPNLPQSGPSADNNRANRAAGNYLLAKVILNSERYTGATPNYQAVIDAVDAITNDGYALESDYFGIFEQDIDNETIWYANTSVGNRIWNGLHYNQNSPDQTAGGWNGFTTLAEFYDSFEGDPNTNYEGDGQEERRGWVPDASNANGENLGIGYGFLIGQQYNEDGSILKDRPGNPLVFSKDLPGLSGNGEETGIRIIKYHPGDEGGSFRNHEIVFRYADAYLMKAEAMLRAGGDATTMVNDLRTLRGATPLGSVSEADLLAERGRELYIEFWRRNDMLRFGQFTRDWEFKNPESVGDETRNLYPIPINALLSNPNLEQNPGY
ncbi:MAG: RagB/SusD family nutrient uptake outer membrane protein [Alteromonas sp.]|nr:RagB/SusD family nutrient uptake outer membrane protein [Alteromonas sp.]MAY21658.1 RagB/SusD family nutrient uptake outer membrane protein [Flavobacteriaceae bacterium]